MVTIASSGICQEAPWDLTTNRLVPGLQFCTEYLTGAAQLCKKTSCLQYLGFLREASNTLPGT